MMVSPADGRRMILLMEVVGKADVGRPVGMRNEKLSYLVSAPQTLSFSSRKIALGRNET